MSVPCQEVTQPVAAENRSHLRLRSKLLAAVACAAAFFSANEAQAQAPTIPLPNGEVACSINLLNGPNLGCHGRTMIMPPVKESCLTLEAEYELKTDFHLQPFKLRKGVAVAKQNQPDSAGTTDRQLKIVVQDDNAIVENTRGDADAALVLGQMLGGNVLRMMVYADAFASRQGRARYNTAVNKARACGYEVMLTLTGRNLDDDHVKHWRSAAQFGHFAAKVSQYFKGRVNLYSAPNEPFQPANPPWLTRLPHHTLPETTLLIYEAAYKALKHTDAANQVIAFDMSPNNKPLEHLRDLVEYAKHPILIDGLGWHWYMPFKYYRDIPRFGRRFNPHSKQIGLNSIDTVEDFVTKMYKQHKIMVPDGTPNGAQPKLFLDEGAFMTHSVKRSKNVGGEQKAAKLYAKAISAVCPDNQIAMFGEYNLIYPPADLNGKNVVFNSSLIKNGRPDVSFYTFGSSLSLCQTAGH